MRFETGQEFCFRDAAGALHDLRHAQLPFYKTGSARDQARLLLPARIEDYVGRDNGVRAIEAYVASPGSGRAEVPPRRAR